MEHRRAADPAAIGAAGHDLSLDERWLDPALSRAAGPACCHALLCQQPGRCARCAGFGLLADSSAGSAGNGCAGGRPQHRAGLDGCGAGTRQPRARIAEHSAGTGRERRRCVAGFAAPRCGHDRRLILHVRDRLDPHAQPGAGQFHPRLRTDAVRLHPGPGVGWAVGAPAH